MKTVKVQGGKDYAMVVERVKEFNSRFPNGSILTEPVSDVDGRLIFKASIIVDGQIVGTGHSLEKEGSSQINKSSHYENCETSAVGRALAFGCGFMPDGSLASDEEIAQARLQQSQVDEHLKTMKVAVDYTSTALHNAIAEDNEEGILEVLKDMHGNQSLRREVNETLNNQQKAYLTARQEKISESSKVKSAEKHERVVDAAHKLATKESA